MRIYCALILLTITFVVQGTVWNEYVYILIIYLEGFRGNSAKQFPCSPGVRPVQCFVNPCLVSWID